MNLVTYLFVMNKLFGYLKIWLLRGGGGGGLKYWVEI